MKILQINALYKRGSTGKIVEAIQESIIDSGNIGKVAYCLESPEDINSFRFENNAEYFIRRVRNKVIGKRIANANYSTQRLIRYMKRNNFDIIHLHVLHHTSVNFIMLYQYLVKSKKPIVISMHDCWSFTGGCYHFTDAKCEQYKSICRNCKKHRSEFDDKLGRAEFLFNEKKKAYSGMFKVYFITVSAWLEQTAAKSMLKNYPIITIYNGIDITIFRKYDENILQDNSNMAGKKLILGVSTIWTENKGINDFIRLADILSGEYHIVLVGTSVNKNCNVKNLTFLNSISKQEDLAKIYSSVEVFLNLSTEETFGLTTAEAMACGTPVVVYDSTAVGEIVEDGCGYKVPPGDIVSVAKKIKQICFEGKEHYTKKCIKVVGEKYSDKTMGKNYLALYKKITHLNNN